MPNLFRRQVLRCSGFIILHQLHGWPLLLCRIVILPHLRSGSVLRPAVWIWIVQQLHSGHILYSRIVQLPELSRELILGFVWCGILRELPSGTILCCGFLAVSGLSCGPVLVIWVLLDLSSRKVLCGQFHILSQLLGGTVRSPRIGIVLQLPCRHVQRLRSDVLRQLSDRIIYYFHRIYFMYKLPILHRCIHSVQHLSLIHI